MMLYPLMTFPDSTEMTFSKVLTDRGKPYFYVYFERWNDNRDDFDTLQIRLPESNIVKEVGFSEKEVKYFTKGAKFLEQVMLSLIPDFEKGKIKINATCR